MNRVYISKVGYDAQDHRHIVQKGPLQRVFPGSSSLHDRGRNCGAGVRNISDDGGITAVNKVNTGCQYLNNGVSQSR